jgi:hypothetical protein
MVSGKAGAAEEEAMSETAYTRSRTRATQQVDLEADQEDSQRMA